METKIKEEYISALNSLQPREAKSLIHFLAGYAMGADKEEMVMEMIIREVKQIKERRC